MSGFLPVDRQTDYLFPLSVEDWLPENRLARFIVEVIEWLDLSELTRQYAAHHPAVLLGLLIYGHATGVPSSARSNVRRTARWHFATSRPTPIPTTTRCPASGAGSVRNWSHCLCKC